MPSSEEIAKLGAATAEKLEHSPASWTVSFRKGNTHLMTVEVVRDGERQAWSFKPRASGENFRLLQMKEHWYLHKGNQVTKGRAYELLPQMPLAYWYLALSTPQIQNAGLLSEMILEKRNGSQVLFRRPTSGEVRGLTEQVLAELNQLRNDDPSPVQKQIAEATRMLQEQLTQGVLIPFDAETGLVAETCVNSITIKLEDFRWLETVKPGVFELPKNPQWEEQTESWKPEELKDCLMFSYDPFHRLESSEQPAADTYVVNVRSKKLRRVPYRGVHASPGCFLKDRSEILVTGHDGFGGADLVKVNLVTGENIVLSCGNLAKGVILTRELSPDGSKVAALRSAGVGALAVKQYQLVDVATGRIQDLGKPGPWEMPISWTPDGDALIVKRLKAADQPEICRLGLDGTVTRLMSGDMPVVNRGLRRLIHRSSDGQQWYSAQLDGSHGGIMSELEEVRCIALSPDEHTLVGVVKGGSRLHLVLSPLDRSSNPVVLSIPAGFIDAPVWR